MAGKCEGIYRSLATLKSQEMQKIKDKGQSSSFEKAHPKLAAHFKKAAAYGEKALELMGILPTLRDLPLGGLKKTQATVEARAKREGCPLPGL